MKESEHEILIRTQTYRDFLEQLFSIRKKRNKQYSLRRFSTQLGISHSHLLDIISGRRNISTRMAKKILSNVHLEISAQHHFLRLVEAQGRAILPILPETDVPVETLSAWYHLPILNLCGLPQLKVTASLASKTLGIPLENARSALLFLTELGHLKAEKDGAYSRVKNFSFRNRTRNKDVNRRQLEFLEQVRLSALNLPPTERALGNMTFTMNSLQFKHFEEKLFNFLHDFCLEAIDSSPKTKHDTIYLATTAMVPLFKITP